ALALDEVVDVGADEVDRGVGRELERVVLDLDRSAVGGDTRLELALADVAPRAGDVAPDADADGRGSGHVTCNGMTRQVFRARRDPRSYSIRAAGSGGGGWVGGRATIRMLERRATRWRAAIRSTQSTKTAIASSVKPMLRGELPSEVIPVPPVRPLPSTANATTLLSVCIAIAASSPPVRQVATAAAMPNTPTSSTPHTSYWNACASANSAVGTTSGTHSCRVQEPSACMKTPRNTYSSVA